MAENIDSPTYRARLVDDEGNPIAPAEPPVESAPDLTGKMITLRCAVSELYQGTACVVFPTPAGSAIGVWTGQKAKVAQVIEVEVRVVKGDDPGSLELEVENAVGDVQALTVDRHRVEMV